MYIKLYLYLFNDIVLYKTTVYACIERYAMTASWTALLWSQRNLR